MRLGPITASIVIYHNSLSRIQGLLGLLQQETCIEHWVVVDNGSSDEIRDAVQEMDGIYVRPGKNLGFGGGHNLALKQLAGMMLGKGIVRFKKACGGPTRHSTPQHYGRSPANLAVWSMVASTSGTNSRQLWPSCDTGFPLRSRT